MLAIPFVLSATMLAYEIVLTRIASLLLTHQYTFLVLGMALLGIAAGAICEYLVAARHPRLPVVSPGMWFGSTATILALTLVLLVQGGTTGGVLALGLAAALPFAASGAIFARLFRLFPHRSGNLYAADLVGAAAGALLAPVLLPTFGPVQTILILAIVLGLAGAGTGLIYGGRRQVLIACIATGAVSGLLVLHHHDVWPGSIPIGKNVDKELPRLLFLQRLPMEVLFPIDLRAAEVRLGQATVPWMWNEQ